MSESKGTTSNNSNSNNNTGGGGGGRGRGGRGGGRGGRGGGRGGGDGRNKGDNSNAKASDPPVKRKENRKAGKRAMQLASMEKKAQAEDAYFRSCQREAAASRKKGNNPATSATREAELFGTQGTQGIHFDKYKDIKVEIKFPADSSAMENDDYMLRDFGDLKSLHPDLALNTERMKYKSATPIQRYAVPLAMKGHDLMCCAQTGSGKTCAFLLPVIAAIAEQDKGNTPTTESSGGGRTPATPRCMVLAPTRELASQIELEAQKLTYGLSISAVAVYGGANPRSQLHDLAFGADIVVATPGRLTDFVDRSIVSLANVDFLVLDEADRMLDMGFCPQIRKLVEQSGMKKEGRQTLMFSATFDKEIQKLAGDFLRPYVWIAVGRVGSTTESIVQVVVKATSDKRAKLKLVVEALTNGPSGRTLVFVQKKRDATWLKKMLQKGGVADKDGVIQDAFTPIVAEDIHGDRSQSQREAALSKFREGKCRVLVATDVAARGLDVSGIEHVINMDLPQAADDFDSYVHRIGRTGRAGHSGLATSLYVPGQQKGENGKIAAQMVLQLRETGQNVPQWLEDECGVSSMSAPKKPRFAGTDVRGKGSVRVSNTTPGQDGKEGDRQGGGGGRGKPRQNGRGGGGRGGRGGGRGEQKNGAPGKQ